MNFFLLCSQNNLMQILASFLSNFNFVSYQVKNFYPLTGNKGFSLEQHFCLTPVLNVFLIIFQHSCHKPLKEEEFILTHGSGDPVHHYSEEAWQPEQFMAMVMRVYGSVKKKETELEAQRSCHAWPMTSRPMTTPSPKGSSHTCHQLGARW